MSATSVRRAVSVFILGAAVVFLCAAGLVRQAAARVFVELLPECSFIELRSVLSSSCCRTFVELQWVCSFVELLLECSFVELKGCSSAELLE